jgi:hypothetical protein
MFTSKVDPAILLAKQEDDARLLVTINNLENSIINVNKLKLHLEEEFKNAFGLNNAGEMIQHVLEDLQQTAKLFEQTAKKVTTNICTHIQNTYSILPQCI